MKKKDSLVSVIFVLTIMSFAILFTILFKPLFAWQLTGIDTPYLLGLTHEQVLYNYDELLHYLLNPFINTLKMSHIPTSASGAFHFYEVKNLFLLNNVIFVSGVVASVWGIRYVTIEKRWYVFAQIGKFLSVLPIGIVLILLAGFNYWFVLFHQIAFGNNDWLFNPKTDPIIYVLPETFFLSCAVVVLIIVQFSFIGWWQYAKRKDKVNF